MPWLKQPNVTEVDSSQSEDRPHIIKVTNWCPVTSLHVVDLYHGSWYEKDLKGEIR